MRVLPVVAILLVAGCLAPAAVHDDLPPGLAVAPVVVDVPVHVVRAGVDAAAFDEAAFLAGLPDGRIPIVESVEWTTRELRHMPVEYRFSYAIHDAPEEFVQDLFAAADVTEGRPNQWLVDYDCAGQGRLGGCGPLAEDAKDILYLDVLTAEQWLLENAGAHGLDFGPRAVTLFLLDGEGVGAVPTDTYHYWRFDDGQGHSKIPQDGPAPTVHAPAASKDEHIAPYHTPKDPTSMRAWGGTGNMLWLDLTAAPSAYDHRPRAPVEDWVDPPLWDTTPAEAAENLARNVGDFLGLRVARDPIYPVHAFKRFSTPIHVFVEEGTQENPDLGRGADLEAWVPEGEIAGHLQHLMPWVEVDVEVMFHMLPDGDPGMAEAIKRARAYGSPSHVSSGYVQAYIRDHWDDYVPTAGPDEFVMPQFYYFFAGPWTFNGFGGAGGWADGDEEGKPWAIFDHFFDVCTRTDVQPCTKNDLGFQNLTILPLHEAGHELGLTHTKDFVHLTEEGVEWRINWLWDSMLSQMSYRHTYPAFDHWDRVFVATAHAADLIERTEALGGDASAPRRLLADGAHEASVQAGWDALRKAERTGASSSGTAPWETVVDTQVDLPASTGVLPGFNLGLRTLRSPLDLPVEDVSVKTLDVDVPEGTTELRVAYEDVTPEGAAAGRSSAVAILDPDGEQVGGIWNDFEGSVVLRPDPLPAGTWQVRLVQASGTPGMYDVTVQVGPGA